MQQSIKDKGLNKGFRHGSIKGSIKDSIKVSMHDMNIKKVKYTM